MYPLGRGTVFLDSLQEQWAELGETFKVDSSRTMMIQFVWGTKMTTELNHRSLRLSSSGQDVARHAIFFLI